MKNRGFTLVELLVVVAIIALLTAIALPQFQKLILKSRRTDAIVTLAAAHKAQTSHFAAHETFLAYCQPRTSHCTYNSTNASSLVRSWVIATNADLGLGDNLLQTRFGYDFGYVLTSAGLNSPYTKYILVLLNNLDDDSYTERVLIHFDDPQALSQNISNGVPFVLFDDITNMP